MGTGAAASLINLLGFITGVALYGMLLWMVFTSRPASNRLALLTGLLGFVWNAGAFGGYRLADLGYADAAPLVLAGAFGALCFLPAVVIHSALRTVEGMTAGETRLLVMPAYAMSGLATIMHFNSAIVSGSAPSQLGLRGVTAGFAILLIALLVRTWGQEGRGRVLWVVAMSIFAVSALHLSNHEGVDPWWLQLAGHHASLPLALLILYQDFRFAFADIFLKRGLAFILLAGLAFGLFAIGVTPRLTADPTDQRLTALWLFMWVATALIYPLLRTSAAWFVDKIVLKRVDYVELAATVSRAIDLSQTPKQALDETTKVLSTALTAESIDWSESQSPGLSVAVQHDRRTARITIPTTERPHYVIRIRDLSGGRRLLSDDVTMLERAAVLVARRIDALRSSEERYRRDVQEQEMRKLAAEAELRALRAQVNPHFLFNALTTIGYLIQTAPERALGTLMRLSALLRGVLKSGEEFVSIGEELDLIEAYLDIERARFEDRLLVRIDVPPDVRRMRIPALIIQPLVENAIKHGISECLAGGEVRIASRVQDNTVSISVLDTGVGVTGPALAWRRARGLGLSNVQQRLERYGAGAAALTIISTPGTGTIVEIRLPLQMSDATSSIPSAKTS